VIKFAGILVSSLILLVASSTWGTVAEPADDDVLEVARVIAGGSSALLTFTNLALSTSDDGSTTWGLVGIGVGLATLTFEAASGDASMLIAAAGMAAVVTGLVSIACDRVNGERNLSRVSLEPSITRRSCGAALSFHF